MTTKRVFFALWPDAQQRDRMRDAINSVARHVEGRAVDRRNWHITLVFLGEVDAARLPDLGARAGRIEFEPFRLSFDRLEYWPRPRVACLVASSIPAELERIVASLNQVVRSAGIVLHDRTYRPHVTVARNARAFATERLSHRLVTEWSGFELVESVSGPGGRTYLPLKQ